MRLPFVRGSIALAAMLAASRLSAQTGTGAIAGVVNDANHRPLAGAIVQLPSARLGAYTGDEGRYHIDRVPPGAVRVIARIPGYRSDTALVTVTADQTVTHDFVMLPSSVTLQTVNVTSPRLNETKAAALQEQKNADNIVSVLSGDEIRSLPNLNAAEAAARMPGVTSERDEGEGKFVEIRGTPPTFSNVEIDGVHIPGTLSGDRSVKLDDIPSDLLGAIEVSKTLMADMDANAIGGTINLESKIPEGSPRGYLSGQYGYNGLESKSQGQGSLTFGGRVGTHQQLGFLLGSTYDRTNRILQDVEPAYVADNVTPGGFIYQVPNGSGFNHVYPTNWSQREYDYYRTRYGLNGDLDYRFSPTSSVYIRGLWGAFFDQANVWHTEVNGNTNPGADTIINGVGVNRGANISTNASNRGPIEHSWALISGGKQIVGPVQLDYNATYSGSSATSHNSFGDNYSAQSNSPLSNFNYTYNTSKLVPQWFPTTSNVIPAIRQANSFALTQVNYGNSGTDGQNVGGGLNALIPYAIGDLPAAFKFGVKYYNEHKSNNPTSLTYNYVGPNTLANYASSYRVTNFYGHICSGCYPMAPFGSIPAVQNGVYSHDPNFQPQTAGQQFSDLTGTWSGTEQVSAVYGMHTLDIAQLHVNVGLRVENTELGYSAFNQDTSGDTTVASLLHVRRHHSYTDFFPSAQLRYQLDENTNLRVAFTRGIARPDYALLIPSFTFFNVLPNSRTQGLSASNPALKPEHSWNYDLLAEHFFPSVGVLSGGVFYKQITDFVFNRTVPYTGQFLRATQYLPRTDTTYYISQPQNGPSAWLYGIEADYTQHLTFLPGVLAGIGFDVNWTWVKSRAAVPISNADSTGYAINASGTDSIFPYRGHPIRHAPIPRQFPNLFNVALLYDYGPVSGRIAGEYTAASIYNYGQDNTSNPQSGDTWNYPHWQIDGSVNWTVFGSTAIQVQVLNLNNAVFGFFNGLPGHGHSYDIQREYTYRTLFIGIRQGF
jgi:TonB-dependent receptor